MNNLKGHAFSTYQHGYQHFDWFKISKCEKILLPKSNNIAIKTKWRTEVALAASDEETNK